MLVNDEGAKPSRKTVGEAGEILLIPLPPRPGEECVITVLYEEKGRSMRSSTALTVAGPRVGLPVNHSTWNLNLPPGYEYPRVPERTEQRSCGC